MQLSGRLRLTTLGDLLGKVLRERLSGTLELTEESGPFAGRVHRLHLISGHIVQVDTRQSVQRLGEMLVNEGCFELSALPAFVEAAVARGVPLGQWLVDNGIVPSSVMVEAVVRQLRLRLDALFNVEDARVTFRLIQPRRRELDVPRPLEPREYLTGRPRARDRVNGRTRSPTEFSGISSERRRDLLLLGLGVNASDSEIRSAFRRLARSLHPDAHPEATARQNEALRLRFADVSVAYHRLIGVTKMAG